jgi:hypothetical protein
VQEVPTAILKKLDLRGAAEQEAVAWRNLLPPEPWCQHVAQSPGQFARWVTSRLSSGARNAPSAVVDARKANQAFRPVPVVGIAERIATRALTDWILEDVDLPERGQDQYRAFVSGPIRRAFPEGKSARLSQASIDYVVQADIAAFYQYVDHGVLLEELQVRTGKVEAARLLIELLGEIQGATYGLPQLLAASDALSEVYIQILERDLTRRTADVWRFNDDFRIAANGYGNAQQALEDLSSAARPLGLILSDHKTSIVRFSTYFWHNAIGEVGDSDVEVNPEEVDVWVEEYPDLSDDELVETAQATLSRLDDESEDPIDLTDPSTRDVRDLRRAFNILARHGDKSGLRHVEEVFRYIPQLSPRLCDYMVSAHRSGYGVARVWNAVAKRSDTHNVWQRAWMAYVARECAISSKSSEEWLQSQFRQAPSGLLHAETSLSLAQTSNIEFGLLDTALRTQPEALAAWYALAINELANVPQQQRRAVRASSPLFALLIDE